MRTTQKRERVHMIVGRSGYYRRPMRALCGRAIRDANRATFHAHPERVTCPTCLKRMSPALKNGDTEREGAEPRSRHALPGVYKRPGEDS